MRKQQRRASYAMQTSTNLFLPFARRYSNKPLWAWTSRAARGPCAEDNSNFSTCKSLFDKIISKTTKQKQREYHVCVNALWHTNTTRVSTRLLCAGQCWFESSLYGTQQMCSTNSVILCCVLETLEQVLTRASILSRSISKYTLGNKGLFVAILGNHTYKVTVNVLRSEKKTVSK